MSKSSFYSGSGLTNTEQDAIEGAKNAAEAARDAAQAAQAAAETARDSSQSSSSTASGHAATATTKANEASSSASNASTHASTSTTKASEASTSASNASDDANDAQKLAINAEDSQFTLSDGSTTGFSALHHKEKALDAQTAAESAQSSATTSETNAATSETNAATSATNAATSETNAATSATNAATSATNAATSETNAATSETNAATSATTASTQASNASSSASDALTSVTNAASYAAVALNHKNAAASSASSASSAQIAAETAKTGAETAKTASETAQAASEAAQAAAEAAILIEVMATVAAGGGSNKYIIDGTSQQTMFIPKGAKVRLDVSDSSLSNHPLQFSTTSDGTHNSGTQFTQGITSVGNSGSTGAYVEVQLEQDAPDHLYFFCGNHSLMGGLVKTAPIGDANFASFANAFTFPTSDGSADQVLKTDGSGNLSFVDQSTGGGNTFDSSIIFEGSTADDFETTLQVTNPTADRTITLPNAGGTVAVSASGLLSLSGNGNLSTTATNTDMSWQSAWPDDPFPSAGSYPIGVGALASAAQFSNSNIAIGDETLNALTNGFRNVAIGHQALKTMTTTGLNTAVGDQAAKVTTGDYNAAFGAEALLVNTLGSDNTAIGAQAAKSLTTAYSTIAVGYNSMPENQTTDNVIAVGAYSGGGQTITGGTFVGVQAGRDNTNSKYYQTAIGFFSMSNNYGDYSVAVGPYSMTNGNHVKSVAVGYDALGRGFTSNPLYNVAIGYEAGASIYSGDYNTIIGYEAVSSADNQYYLNNCTVLGSGATASSSSASNQITLGNSSISSLRCNDTSISSLSDERDKTAIEDLPYGLDFINDIRPVKFTWNRRDGSMGDRPEIGFIAQELYDAELSHSSTRYTRLVSWENPEKLEARPMATYPILVKAVQELSAKCDALEAQIAELEGT